MADVLTKICDDKREWIASNKAKRSLADLDAVASEVEGPRGFIDALRRTAGMYQISHHATAKQHCTSFFTIITRIPS